MKEPTEKSTAYENRTQDDESDAGVRFLDGRIGRFDLRLKEAIGEESARNFAQRAGLSASAVRAYLIGTSEPGVSALVAMADAAGYSIAWLAIGEGPKTRREVGEMMAKAKSAGQVQYQAQGPQIPDCDASGMAVKVAEPRPGGHGVDFSAEFALVPRLDVAAAAGAGAFVGDEREVERLAFRRSWLREMGLDASRLALVTVVGDSMEPTLSAGDVVLVDVSPAETLIDGIYVIRRDGTVVVKRVQTTIAGGDIYIKSDNPRYSEERVPKEQIDQVRIVGRVVWLGRSI